MKTRKCRICGCTDNDCHQCIEKTGHPCSWVEWDLCSACVHDAPKKEYPCLFSTLMVQSILEGRKTKTRRMRGLKKINKNPDDWYFEWADFALQKPWRFTQKSTVNEQSIKERNFNQEALKCPYGNIGDQLWVRESFIEIAEGNYEYKAGFTDEPIKWKPSIHMPREACRILLEIVSIKVERLEDISEDDAKAEGVEKMEYGYRHYCPDADDVSPGGDAVPDAKSSFLSLFVKINGKAVILSNPWVWVIEFRRVK